MGVLITKCERGVELSEREDWGLVTGHKGSRFSSVLSDARIAGNQLGRNGNVSEER